MRAARFATLLCLGLTAFSGHAAQAQTPSPTGDRFDPAVVELEPGTVLFKARAAFDARRWRDTRVILEASDTPAGEARIEERFLLGRVMQIQGDWSHAHIVFHEVGQSTHRLAQWARLMEAQVLQARRPQAAQAIATQLRDSESMGLIHDRAVELLARMTPEVAQATAPENEAQTCEAEQRRAQELFRSRDRNACVQLVDAMLAHCTSADARAWALFLRGRAYVQLGNRQEALASFDELLDTLPTHRLADDALVRGAAVARDMGDQNGRIERLTRAIEDLPEGDMRADAFFELAWAHRDARAFDRALEVLDRALAFGIVEQTEDSIGRIAYWRARTLLDLGRAYDAAFAFESTALRYPHTYYAQLALARLRSFDAARARDIESTIVAASASGAGTFEQLARMQQPGFERVVGLLRVGDVDNARDEVEALGAFSDGEGSELLPVFAALWNRAGYQEESVRLARRGLVSATARASLPTVRALLQIAYPRAFSPEIEDAAQEAGIAGSLLRAIAREESGFDPEAVSAVQAHGLVQLREDTARRFARPLRITVNADALHEPRTNLRIGAAFLSFLSTRYRGRVSAIPAAYNAGESNADKWLRERSTLEFDEWVERIPFEESRRYTRRVMQSWGVYATLEGAAMPIIEWPADSARAPVASAE